MNQAIGATGTWPPAFSDEFIADARALFRDTDHVMIVGPLGSHRGALASALTGEAAPSAWGRETQAFDADEKQYVAVNQLFPNLNARPDESCDDVTRRAMAILAKSFGRPALSLREADLCDLESVEVLARLVESGAISLVSTIGPAAAANHRFSGQASRIDLPPLDDAIIAHLLTARFGATPHPTTVAMLAARSQGAYAVLQELAESGFQTGQLRVIGGTLVTDAAIPIDDVDEAIVAVTWSPRFAADHPARDLIDVVALAMYVKTTEAEATFGEPAVSIALADGALRRAEDHLVFASRVEALLVRRDLGVERRSALFARYGGGLQASAEITGAAPRMAEWLMSIDAPLSADLAVRATAEANREGRYHLALRFANSIPVSARPSRLLIEQCHALSESGASDELDTLLRSVDPTSLNDDDLLPFLAWISRTMPADDVRAAVSVIADAMGPRENGRRAMLSLAHLLADLFQTGSEIQRQHLTSLIQTGDLSPVGRSVARVALATSLRQASRLDDALTVARGAATEILNSPDVATCHVEAALEVQIVCQISAADFDGAHDSLTLYSAPGVPFGNVGRIGTTLWGLQAFFSGDIGAAMAHAQLALARAPESDPHRLRPWMEAMAAQILTQVGDIDQVYDLLEASHRHPANPRRQHDLERRVAQACVHDAIGDPERALVLLQGVVDEAREHDLTLTEVDAAVLSVQIGGPVHLRQLLRAVESIDSSCGTSWIWARFAWAVRDNNMRALVTLAEELDTDDKPLFAAEVAQFTLDIARRAADMSPEQRQSLVAIADPMQHRHVTRS